jgi:hypothetical protein
MASARIALAIALVASSVAVGITTGCAGDGVQIMSTSHDDKNDPIQRGYDVGYDRGKSAGMRGAQPDSKMPGNEKNAETVAAYKSGYEDGYAGRSNRFGTVEARDWMHQDEVPQTSDYQGDNEIDDK